MNYTEPNPPMFRKFNVSVPLPVLSWRWGAVGIWLIIVVAIDVSREIPIRDMSQCALLVCAISAFWLGYWCRGKMSSK
jgi:hypothetical protein